MCRGSLSGNHCQVVRPIYLHICSVASLVMLCKFSRQGRTSSKRDTTSPDRLFTS